MCADNSYYDGEEDPGYETRAFEGLRHGEDTGAERRLQQVGQCVHVPVNEHE